MKTKINNISLAVFTLLVLCPFSAFAIPQSMDLDILKLTPNGDLKFIAKFDEAADRKCKIYTRIKLYHEDQKVTNSEVVSGTIINKRVRKGQKKIQFKASELPGAKRSEGKDPIMAMQAWLKCGDESVYSNVEARFIICGEGRKRVSLARYFTTIEDNIE